MHPDKIDYKKSLAEIINRLGYVDSDRGDFPAALRNFQAFQKLCQQILDGVRDGPKPLNIQDLLARSHYNIAAIYRVQADAAQSLEASKKAAENWSKLASSHPSVTSYQMDTGTAYWSMAWAQNRLGHHSDALASVDQVLTICDRLISTDLTNLEYQREKAGALNLKGVIYDDQRENNLARTTFSDVVELRQSILDRSKGIDDYIVELCVSLENLGETYVDGGDDSEGLEFYRQALGHRQRLNASHPENREYAKDVVNAWITIGNILRQAGKLPEAGRSYNNALEVVRPLVEAEAKDSELQGELAQVLERKAGVLADLGQFDDALGLLNQAIALAQSSLKTAEDGKKPREYLSEAYWSRARLLKERGDTKGANQAEADRVALWKERPAI